jgi:hypothetical protein
MTKRCKHLIQMDSNEPEEILCIKCKTSWNIKECATYSSEIFSTLPLEVKKYLRTNKLC